jgi:hypothetical protein
MLKIGKINNCEKCGSSYSQYKEPEDANNDWAEMWNEIPEIENGVVKKPKGVCQFCNPKSKFYLND